MKWCVCEREEIAFLKNTAGIKARDDVEEILLNNNCSPIFVDIDIERENKGVLGKLKAHKNLVDYWQKKMECVKEGDLVIIQFPLRKHTMFFSKVIKQLTRRGVKTVLILHDLEYMRVIKRKDVSLKMRIRVKFEELSVINTVSYVVVHNEKMKLLMNENLNIPMEKMINLQIFDYLVDKKTSFVDRSNKLKQDYSCIIAGNLLEGKSKYVYDLPDDVRFELYGPNYTGEAKENVNYHGSFAPEELPYKLEGNFGIVWDGLSSHTCEGVFGQYLKVNNPHKTSLYVASEIPIVIWEEAALADFVKENGIGITVKSLFELKAIFEKLSVEDYQKMVDNTKHIAEKLRKGQFLLEAIKACE